ncbi:cyclin-dependent kinase 1-like [Scaptodrosophila lebanonensis]|uniref:Cyclin-dependent kinase 1-like n=1 Tax=Drosophila lebanonensis TaxID=7225 RepID=A0A6J2TAI6_DROLE|nr:cyclin-dependent kinase 1-like [Scaptodrosophila lebanonensis]
MENYELIEKIGEGTYGVVFKSLNRRQQCNVALKKIRINSDDEGVPSTAIREISFLKELKHPNIVELQEVVVKEKSIYLVFEYLSMDLRKYLDSLPKGKRLERNLVRSYMRQVTSAILFCHRRRILHRDLKPQNLLINRHGRIKVGDFGLARAFCVPIRVFTHEVVTLWYRAPEILLGSTRYACAMDIWSIGCIYFEMTTGRPLFAGDSEIDQLFCIFRILGTPTEDAWPGLSTLPHFKNTFPNWTHRLLDSLILEVEASCFQESGLDLLKKMVNYAPEKRISAKEMLEHKYFEGFLSE